MPSWKNGEMQNRYGIGAEGAGRTRIINQLLTVAGRGATREEEVTPAIGTGTTRVIVGSLGEPMRKDTLELLTQQELSIATQSQQGSMAFLLDR